MEKNFDKWNKNKKKIHTKNDRILFHEREIWWCALGVNIGFEQDGKNHDFERPVIIFRKFNNEVCLALPITTRAKNGKFYFTYDHDERQFSIILSQIRLIDAKRLLRKIRTLSRKEFSQLNQVFESLLKQTTPQ